MSVRTIVSCNGRRYFQPCRSFLPLGDNYGENAARYESHRAGWSTFSDQDYCPSCTREQAAHASGGDQSATAG